MKVDFGYGIAPSRTLDIDTTDKTLSQQLLKREPTTATCIACGTCMASCSANQFIPFNLRQLQLFVHRGKTQTIAKAVEHCMLCGKCQMLCPRGINTRNIVLALHSILNQQ